MISYKVHFENRFLLISSEPDRLQKYGLFHKFSTTPELYKLISKFQEDISIPSVNIYGPDIKHLWKIFRIYFNEVPAAGGLVKHKSGRFLFIKKRGMWDLPKGHVDSGETPEKCALREVTEECGIKGLKIIRPLETTYHTYQNEGISCLKKTDWFLMQYDGKLVSRPQTKENITEAVWLKPDEIMKIKSGIWTSLTDLVNTYILSA